MMNSKAVNNSVAHVHELQRRIRFLQRSIVQLAGQPQVHRKHLLQSLYASLHKARQELHKLPHKNTQKPQVAA